MTYYLDLLESIQPARFELRILSGILVSDVQADSQIAIVLAIRELLSATIFSESVQASPFLLAYTSIMPKKRL